MMFQQGSIYGVRAILALSCAQLLVGCSDDAGKNGADTESGENRDTASDTESPDSGIADTENEGSEGGGTASDDAPTDDLDSDTVPHGNSAPVAEDITITVRMNTPRTIPFPAYDPDGDTLTYEIVFDAYDGTTEISGDSVIYTPNPDYQGEDLVEYTVFDGELSSEDEGYIRIEVEDEDYNELPIVSDEIIWTEPDTAVDISLSAIDPDGDTLTFALLSSPSNGTLKGGKPDWTYTPKDGFIGSDFFAVTVDDGSGPLELFVTVCVSPRPVFGEMTVDERFETMTLISEKSEALGELSTLSIMAELERYARTLPGVAFVGTAPGGVFGQFKDGVFFLFGASVPMGTPDEAERRSPEESNGAPTPPVSAAARVVGNPVTGNKAILLNGFDNAAPFPADISGDLATLLSEAGYETKVKEATIDNLVINDTSVGVVHLRTHGGGGMVWDKEAQRPGGTSSIWSTTPAVKENFIKYDAEMKSGLVTVMEQVVAGGGKARHLGISNQFIQQKWRLAHGAYVHFSACWLGEGVSWNPTMSTPCCNTVSPIQNAVLSSSVGGLLFGGWTKPTEVAFLDKAAKYVFDRMLGGNAVLPLETPPQRPMGAKSILADMTKKNLDVNDVVIYDFWEGATGWKSVFRFITPLGSGGRLRVDRLAPSVTQLYPDTAAGELYVYGDIYPYISTSDASKIKVSIDRVDYPLIRDAIDYLVFEMPKDASGDVYLNIDGRISNRTRLSRWRGTMTYTITGPGTLKQEWEYNVTLVGDVHPYRDKAGGTPTTHENYIALVADDSSASFEASGTAEDDDYRVTWSGGASLSPHTTADTCEGCFTMSAKMIPESPKKLWWNMLVYPGENGVSERIEAKQGDEWQTVADHTIVTTFPLDNSGMTYTGTLDVDFFGLKLPAVIGEDGTIEKGDTGEESMEFIAAGNATGWTFTHRLRWTAMSPSDGSEIDSGMPR